jgi:hypothetical protein
MHTSSRIGQPTAGLFRAPDIRTVAIDHARASVFGRSGHPVRFALGLLAFVLVFAWLMPSISTWYELGSRLWLALGAGLVGAILGAARREHLLGRSFELQAVAALVVAVLSALLVGVFAGLSLAVGSPDGTSPMERAALSLADWTISAGISEAQAAAGFAFLLLVVALVALLVGHRWLRAHRGDADLLRAQGAAERARLAAAGTTTARPA